MNQNINKTSKEEEKINRISEEFEKGLESINKYNSSVTFYGSTRINEGDLYYEKVRNLANRISKELGYTIFTGGGPGIMEAANRGAYEAKGKSIGLTIRLPHEQFTNKYVTEEILFNFFFARQSSMYYATEVCIFCPGGYGTLSELFEILTLRQTKKLDKIPLILYGKSFWNPIVRMMIKTLLKKYKTISKEDLNLFIITDNEDKIIDIIKESKIRNGDGALE